MTKDVFPARKTTSLNLMDAHLARINSTHAWNALLMTDALTVLMVTLLKRKSVCHAPLLIIVRLVTKRDSAQVAKRLIS